MHVTALTPAAITLDLTGCARKTRLDALEIARLEPSDGQWLACLTGQSQSVAIPFSTKHVAAGGGWTRVTIESDYLTPYLDLLRARTGGPIPLCQFPSLSRLTFTHLVESAELQDHRLRATIIVGVFLPLNRNSLSPEDRDTLARERATRCLHETIGHVLTTPEYISEDGISYKRNPSWGRGPSPVRPAATHERLWQDLFSAWVSNTATPAQRQLLTRVSRTPGLHHTCPTLSDHTLYLDQYRTVYTWDQFRAEEEPPIPAVVA